MQQQQQQQAGASFPPNPITTEQIQKVSYKLLHRASANSDTAEGQNCGCIHLWAAGELSICVYAHFGNCNTIQPPSKEDWTLKCLEDNKNLILAILENQNLGKVQECAQYQAVLQKNLMYLAAIADAQPPAATPTPTPTPPQTSTPQMPPNTIPQQANNYMQQHQAAAALQQSQQGGVPKLPFQLNALRAQDQQQQILQFQQQQQQQLQAQMGMRAGAQNGMLGMHQAMQSALAGNPMDGRGMKQDGSDAASGGDGGQGKARGNRDS